MLKKHTPYFVNSYVISHLVDHCPDQPFLALQVLAAEQAVSREIPDCVAAKKAMLARAKVCACPS